MSDFATINALNSNSNESHHTLEKIEDEPKATHANGDHKISLLKKIRSPSDLQIKLESQLQKSRQVKATSGYTSKDLQFSSSKVSSAEEVSPLVSYENSEDEFHDIDLKINKDEDIVIYQQPKKLSRKYEARDCTQHLLYDGFRLDELSDDEDLDLIVPKAGNASWCSCDSVGSCNIQ